MTAAMLGDRLVIGNRVDELRRMSRWLRESARELEIPQDVVFRLELCANEAVFNIISYAYDDTNPHDITLDLRRTGCGATLVICDDGRPFNPLSWPAHRAVTRIEDARAGGLGIHFIRNLMGRCDYRRVENLNELVLEARSDPPRSNA